MTMFKLSRDPRGKTMGYSEEKMFTTLPNFLSQRTELRDNLLEGQRE